VVKTHRLSPDGGDDLQSSKDFFDSKAFLDPAKAAFFSENRSQFAKNFDDRRAFPCET